MTEETNQNQAATAPVPPPAKKATRAKSVVARKASIRSAGRFPIVHSKLGIRIPTDSSVEVILDAWTLNQIKRGIFIEV